MKRQRLNCSRAPSEKCDVWLCEVRVVKWPVSNFKSPLPNKHSGLSVCSVLSKILPKSLNITNWRNTSYHSAFSEVTVRYVYIGVSKVHVYQHCTYQRYIRHFVIWEFFLHKLVLLHKIFCFTWETKKKYFQEALCHLKTNWFKKSDENSVLHLTFQSIVILNTNVHCKRCLEPHTFDIIFQSISGFCRGGDQRYVLILIPFYQNSFHAYAYEVKCYKLLQISQYHSFWCTNDIT